MPELWKTISDFNWPTTPNPEKGLPEKLIDAINSKNLSTLISLYSDDAIHITAERTIQGKSALRDYFENLLKNDLQGHILKIDDVRGNDKTQHFSWVELKESSEINQGEDTIGILNEKILYHYSSTYEKSRG
jgi:hypothetical protein